MSRSPGSEYSTVFSNVTQCSLVCTSASTFGKAYAIISRMEDIKSKFRRNQDRIKTFLNTTQK